MRKIFIEILILGVFIMFCVACSSNNSTIIDKDSSLKESVSNTVNPSNYEQDAINKKENKSDESSSIINDEPIIIKANKDIDIGQLVNLKINKNIDSIFNIFKKDDYFSNYQIVKKSSDKLKGSLFYEYNKETYVMVSIYQYNSVNDAEDAFLQDLETRKNNSTLRGTLKGYKDSGNDKYHWGFHNDNGTLTNINIQKGQLIFNIQETTQSSGLTNVDNILKVLVEKLKSN